MITVLCGGFGAARFLDGLRAVATDLCCVVNTGDDLDYVGLHVSPDVDSVLYALAGCFAEDRGFGVAGDTLHCNAALARYGDDWFSLGDRDLATNLRRTAWLRQGLTLSEATRRLVDAWDLRARVLPMSDDPAATVVVTPDGPLAFQEYTVVHRGQPPVEDVRFSGIRDARPAPGVLTAIRRADLVIVAPSNPVSSIGPILALPGVREALELRRRPVVAVTPVVSGAAPRTPPEQGRARMRAAFMAATGHEHRASAVGRMYASFLDGFVLDERDDAEREDLSALGVAVLSADTLARSERRPALAEAVVAFGLGLKGS